MTIWSALRGILLFGSIRSVFNYAYQYHRLNKAVQNNSNQFVCEKIYIEMRRNQDTVLYGQRLNFHQRQTKEALEANTSKSIVRLLLVGRNINKEGEVRFRTKVETLMIALILISTILSAVLLLMCSIATASINIDLSAKVSAITLLSVIIIFPLSLLNYISIAPSYAYFRYRQSVSGKILTLDN